MIIIKTNNCDRIMKNFNGDPLYDVYQMYL